MKYAFFLDIDGTLVWGDYAPPRNIEMIKRARKDGHLVFLNTGRSLGFIPNFVLDTFELDGIVAGSGAYCSIGDKVLMSAHIPTSDLKKTFDYLSPRGRTIIFEGENEVLVHNRESKHFPTIRNTDEFDSKFAYVKVEKVHIPGVLTKEEFDFMNTMFFTVQQYDYAECAIKGCDKAVGMKLVIDNLPVGFVSVAMGDSYNDIEMLENADIAVAMANSPDSVKKLCPIVSSDARDGGVADAFEKILGYDKE